MVILRRIWFILLLAVCLVLPSSLILSAPKSEKQWGDGNIILLAKADKGKGGKKDKGKKKKKPPVAAEIPSALLYAIGGLFVAGCAGFAWRRRRVI